MVIMQKLNTNLLRADAIGVPNINPAEISIRAECMRSVLGNAPPVVIGMLIGLVIVAVSLRKEVPRADLVLWVGIMLGHMLVRSAQVAYFRRRFKAGANDSEVASWIPQLSVAAAFSGCCWGSAMWIVFPAQSPLHQVMLLMLLYMVGAVALVQSAAIYAACIALMLPCLLLVGIKMVQLGGGVYDSFALFTFLLMGMLMFLGRNINRSFVDSIRLRFENQALLSELTKRSEEAERANRAKTQFLAAASHDLRQPMHALGLLVGTLAKVRDEPTRKKIEGGITEAVNSLEALLGSLLDISKLDAGVIEAAPSGVHLQPLFDRLGNEFAALADDKGLVFKVRPISAMVQTDAVLLERILRNLLANAFRYTERGGVLLSCRVRERKDKGQGQRQGQHQAMIEVWDTGSGIPASQHHAIFQEFFQLANPERDREKGLGLGLAIVDRLVRLLGHTLTLRSRVGRGSVFCVAAPLAAHSIVTQQQPPQPPPQARITTIPHASLNGVRILVLDDERGVRDAMSAMLRVWGAAPIEAATLEQAIALAPPDLIVADYRLGGNVTGAEAVAALRTYWGEDVPALIVTGDTAPDRIAELSRMRMPHLHKPVNPARLQEMLVELMAK